MSLGNPTFTSCRSVVIFVNSLYGTHDNTQLCTIKVLSCARFFFHLTFFCLSKIWREQNKHDITAQNKIYHLTCFRLLSFSPFSIPNKTQQSTQGIYMQATKFLSIANVCYFNDSEQCRNNLVFSHCKQNFESVSCLWKTASSHWTMGSTIEICSHSSNVWRN